jgi:hypothetical protein
MPITCESPRNVARDADQEADAEFFVCPSKFIQTRVPQYAMEIAEVARERGFEADWGRKEGGYYAEVFDISDADFSTILEIASKRLTL